MFKKYRRNIILEFFLTSTGFQKEYFSLLAHLHKRTIYREVPNPVTPWCDLDYVLKTDELFHFKSYLELPDLTHSNLVHGNTLSPNESQLKT